MNMRWRLLSKPKIITILAKSLLAELRGQLFNLKTIYKLKMKLLFNGEELWYTETNLLNFDNTLPLAKLGIASSRLASNGLLFSVNILVSMQLVTFLLLSNISELRIGAKTKKFR